MSNGGSQVEAAGSAEDEYLREVAEMLAYRERQLTQRALESLEGPGLEAPAPAQRRGGTRATSPTRPTR